MGFCFHCGATLQPVILTNETVPRLHCVSCGHTHYDNPKVLVSTLAIYEDRLLWMRRALPPFKNKWAFPGGYLELNETMQEGAVRELHEETGIVISADDLIPAMIATVEYSIAGEPLSEVRMGFRVHLRSDACAATGEASEVCFFDEANAPWHTMAYPSTSHVMRSFYQDICNRDFGLYMVHSTTQAKYKRIALDG